MQLTKSTLVNFFNKHSKKIITLSLLCLMLLAFSQQTAHASRWVDNAQDSFTAISPTFGVQAGARPMDPRTYVANIIKIVLGFLGFIAVCLIIYAGLTWMTSNGDSKKTDKAKGIMTAAVIGLFIILAAFSITAFITNAIIGSTGARSDLIRQNY